MHSRFRRLLIAVAGLACASASSGDTVAPSPAPGFRVHPEKTAQVILGIGFEIQSDSIGSGNHGLPEAPIAIPHDLTVSERKRLADEMLKGFRYCRLAGGLYWRGLDAERKRLRPRWPEQLVELRTLLDTAGVEGLSLEYWSPAPFWKANQALMKTSPQDQDNVLRCFGTDWANDPVYKGDTTRFLNDFAEAMVGDIATLEKAGLKTVLWGLQNEPHVSHTIYPTCLYKTGDDYVKTYRAVAGAVRRHDPKIMLFADTEGHFPRKIATGMKDPEVASLVDAYAVHITGSSSEEPRKVHDRIVKELPPRPWFQNEYEYLHGGATPDRCLNTVQHIMNSFQLAGNPTWFWIHALKPIKNAEASGYSLGFWQSIEEPTAPADPTVFRRWRDGPEMVGLPAKLRSLEMISSTRGESSRPGIAYAFSVNQPVTVYLLVEQCGEMKLDPAWKKTDMTVSWGSGSDVVYERKFAAGNVAVPEHKGKQGDRFGAPSLAFVEPSSPASFKAMIGLNVPIQIRSEYLVLQKTASQVKPGHWIYNPYNWYAVGSFVRHMPWNCVALSVDETAYDPEGRILAFRRPDGKLSVVVSNRGQKQRLSVVDTGLASGTWKGFRYTPHEAGRDTMGIPIGTKSGAKLEITLPPQSWEFWEQQ